MSQPFDLRSTTDILRVQSHQSKSRQSPGGMDSRTLDLGGPAHHHINPGWWMFKNQLHYHINHLILVALLIF